MPDNKTVYLIATGEYSEYRIVTAFSTLEAAKNYCRYGNGSHADDGTNDSGGDYSIEEMELDTENLAPPDGYDTYTVAITMDGQHADVKVGTFGYDEYDKINPYNTRDLGKRRSVRFHRECVGGDRLPTWPRHCVATENHMEVFVLARNPGHAIKIANERRAFCAANNLFDIAMQCRFESESKAKHCRLKSKDDVEQSWATDIMWSADDAQE